MQHVKCIEKTNHSVVSPSIDILTHEKCGLGAIQVLHNAVGGGWVSTFPKKGVQFNVISVTRGWMPNGVKF